MDRPLPKPITANDLYNAAILEELRGLREAVETLHQALLKEDLRVEMKHDFNPEILQPQTDSGSEEAPTQDVKEPEPTKSRRGKRH
jgi:hypothetical protein